MDFYRDYLDLLDFVIVFFPRIYLLWPSLVTSSDLYLLLYGVSELEESGDFNGFCEFMRLFVIFLFLVDEWEATGSV